MHGIRRGIVAASVQEAVGGGFLKGWCVIMRHGPPASHATPSVCARGLHMPPPCKGMGLKPIGRALPGKRRRRRAECSGTSRSSEAAHSTRKEAACDSCSSSRKNPREKTQEVGQQEEEHPPL